MKTIQQFNTWLNGKQVIAGVIHSHLVHDNLTDFAQFYWRLHSVDEIGNVDLQIQDGNFSISGEAYQSWNGNNEAAWNMISNGLNIVITGEYTFTNTTTNTSTSTDVPEFSTTTSTSTL